MTVSVPASPPARLHFDVRHHAVEQRLRRAVEGHDEDHAQRRRRCAAGDQEDRVERRLAAERERRAESRSALPAAVEVTSTLSSASSTTRGAGTG